jgi:hypothetical protein
MALSIILLNACASTQPCSLLFVGPAKERPQIAWNQCRWWQPPTAQQLPPVQLDPARTVAIIAMLQEAERFLPEGNTDQAMASFASAFGMLQDAPQLLPEDPASRGLVYRAMATWTTLAAEKGDSIPGLFQWLATHMPDQTPSVRTLTPELELQASREAEKARKASIPLSAPTPTGCTEKANLVVDGLPLGALPVKGIPVPPGPHVYWIRCGTLHSSPKRFEVSQGHIKLPKVDVASETRLAQLHTVQQSPENRARENDVALLRRLAHTNGAAASLAPSNDGQWLVASVARQHPLVVDDLAVKEPLLLDYIAQDDTLTLASALLGAGALAAAGLGIWANVSHNQLVGDTNSSTQDYRESAAAFRDLSLWFYGGAALLGTAALSTWAVDLLTRPDAP